MGTWEIWVNYCRARQITPWIDTPTRHWDQDVLSFSTWGHTVVKNGRGALAVRFNAIRSLHLMEGRGDIEGESFRTRALIEDVKRKRGANQRLPINPEMLLMGGANLHPNTPTGSEMWGALMFGLHFALRVGEIEKLQDRDIMFETAGGQTCVTAHIRVSKTDQCKFGAQRTLVMTGCTLCPVTGIAQWLGMKSWHPRASIRIFGSSLFKRPGNFWKGLAVDCGMDQERAISHSMREGCATTLYANGVAPADIRRWGRWKPPVYMRYVGHENVKLHTLRHALARRTNLTDHMLALNRRNKR